MTRNLFAAARLALAACFLLTAAPGPLRAADPLKWVDPRIGTGGHGHVFFGASVPFGMVQLGPTCVTQGWDWCSGYHDGDHSLVGFGHQHLSGTGIGDLGDIEMLPVVGAVTSGRQKRLAGPDTTTITRADDHAEPGYYATRLLPEGIDVELTATSHVGLHRYTYPAGTATGAILVDLQSGIGWDRATRCALRQVGPRAIEGYRLSRGWASDQRVYFYAELSEPIKRVSGDSAFARLDFDLNGRRRVTMRVTLSATGTADARANLLAEARNLSFDDARRAATRTWRRELSKIDLRQAPDSVKRVFYTALYHTMVEPSEFSNADGSYLGADHRRHAAAGYKTYTTLSLWDTYRALHPLMTLIHPDRVPHMVRTMLAICREQGKLPVWHLMGCETNTMVGNPGIPVVADAICKGFAGFDHDEAFEAMKRSAMLDDRGQAMRRRHGYIPCDSMNESVASDMEYAIADGALAAAARHLGRKDDYQYFLDRSHSYRHYWDAATGFIRGRDASGHWRTPFNPFHSVHRADDYTEGNAWQYTFLWPHDVAGMEALVGHDRLLARLDSLFLAQGDLGEGASPDISGLIGQYAHGNEPSHHVIYLYTLLGRPWQAAPLLQQVMQTLYSPTPDGLCGNEDAGQMSAWYVLSALGFYQVEPAGGPFVFGFPMVDDAVVRLGRNKLHVRVEGRTAGRQYIQSITLNGRPLHAPAITYDQLRAGGTLTYRLGSEPRRWW